MGDQPITNRNVELEVEALLAEFNALRKEIEYRTRSQQGIVVANVTAFAAALAAYIQLSNPLLLLVIPLLSSFFGFYWLDHSYMIDDLGRYIRENVQPKVASSVGSADVLLWEKHVGDIKIGVRKLRFFTLVAGLFLLPSILSLWLSYNSVWESVGYTNKVLWVSGAAFALLWLIDRLRGFELRR